MIFEVVLNIFSMIIRTIFFVTQVLPDMPSAITNVANTISSYAVTGIGFVFEILGRDLSLAVLTIVPIYITFRLTYSMLLFIYNLIKL